jgi:O-antigen ligase
VHSPRPEFPARSVSAAVSEPPPTPPVAAALSLQPDPYWQVDLDNPFRRIGVYFALVFVFVRFSMIHEVIGFHTGVHLYLVAALGLPSILFATFSGGIRRTLRYRASHFWLAFAGWLVLTIPLSAWQGGSFALVYSYLQTQFVMLFIIGGLILTWTECRRMIYAVALGSLTNVLTAKMFPGIDADGRFGLGLGSGSIANANDFAAHLLFVLPFALFVFLTAGRNWLSRLVSLCVLSLGLYEVIKTGSRGAVIALAIGIAFALLKGPTFLRIAGVLAVPLAALLLAVLLPNETLRRYATLYDADARAEDQSAELSMRARTILLQKSAEFSLQHPLFGVGPGEFQDYEASTAKAAGRRGSWQVTHNSYTQISSEAGIPALLFMLAALVSTYRILNKTHKQARARGGFQPIVIASFSAMLSLVAFGAVIFFLSLAYHFYLPALTGIATVICRAAQAEFSKAERLAPDRQPAQAAGPGFRPKTAY